MYVCYIRERTARSSHSVGLRGLHFVIFFRHGTSQPASNLSIAAAQKLEPGKEHMEHFIKAQSIFISHPFHSSCHAGDVNDSLYTFDASEHRSDLGHLHRSHRCSPPSSPVLKSRILSSVACLSPSSFNPPSDVPVLLCV